MLAPGFLMCSNVAQSKILDRTGTCIRVSPKAESLIWRAEVFSILLPTAIYCRSLLVYNSSSYNNKFAMVQRLFFLNGDQDLSAFLLVNLGIIKYPSYNCIITKQIFSNRSDLLAYEEVFIEIVCIFLQSSASFILHINFTGHWTRTNNGWMSWWRQHWIGI